MPVTTAPHNSNDDDNKEENGKIMKRIKTYALQR